MEERLQKILARSGYGSRRASEELIAAGRVKVNGKTATLGMKADPEKDQITLDGKHINPPESKIYIALNKPPDVISAASSPDKRPTVRDIVPVPGRLYPVGRLDAESEGLILLTNDGALANRLTHPRYGHEKEYQVLVTRPPDQDQLEAWRHGVVLEDGYRTRPVEVSVESGSGRQTWLRVILKEGRKRQIREMGMKTGLPVVRIIRTRIGSLELGNLKPGQWRYLTPEEVTALKGETEKQRTRSTRTREELSKPRSESSKRGGAGRVHRSSEKNKRS